MFVFLIGGAGNGKSKLAGEVVKKAHGTLEQAPEAFARRVYDFSLRSGGRLTVVNDATIPPSAVTLKPPLVCDVASSLDAQTNLLACVNRGVLIGEASVPLDLLTTQSEQAAHSLLSWLLSSGRGHAGAVEGWTITSSTAREGNFAHYRHAIIREGTVVRAAVHVVYMDQASLLEPWPQEIPLPQDVREDAALEVRPLSIVPLLARQSGGQPISAFAAPLREAASAFLTAPTHLRPGGELDPVYANATALSIPEFANSWCALVRGAEIISGVRFTYRELWALFGHSLVGAPPESGFDKLSSWVAAGVRTAQEGDLPDRLGALMALAQLRTHMVLFGGTKIRSEGGAKEKYPWPHVSNEALQALALADPLRDYGPAGGQKYSELVDAISGIEDGRLPGQLIASNDLQVARSWSAFDTHLENTVAELVAKGVDRPELKRRNFILAWYGQYVFRLVALARGWPAHVSTVDRWQQSWIQAGSNGRLPAELEQAVLRVLLPTTSTRAQVKLPLLRPRIEEVPEGEDHVSVEVQQQLFLLYASTSGDQISIEIRREGLVAAETILDFHLVREAEAREKGHGFTDSLLLVEPRLERMRASVLAFELARAVGDGKKPRYIFRRNSDFHVG